MKNQNTSSSKSNEDKQKYIDALEKAKKNDPGNEFVLSCERFFVKAGFLTPKQFTAIEKIKPKKDKKNDFTNSRFTGSSSYGGFVSDPDFHRDIERYNYDNWDMSPGEKG